MTREQLNLLGQPDHPEDSELGLVQREVMRTLRELGTLTADEAGANGESYNAIAERLGLPIRARTDASRAGYTRCKAIENALSRARAKIRRALAEDRPVVTVNPTTSPGATGGTTYLEEAAA